MGYESWANVLRQASWGGILGAGDLGWGTWSGGLGTGVLRQGSWGGGLLVGWSVSLSVGAGVLGLESWDGGLGVRVGWLVSQCQSLGNHGLREPNRIDSNFREKTNNNTNNNSNNNDNDNDNDNDDDDNELSCIVFHIANNLKKINVERIISFQSFPIYFWSDFLFLRDWKPLFPGKVRES